MPLLLRFWNGTQTVGARTDSRFGYHTVTPPRLFYLGGRTFRFERYIPRVALGPAGITVLVNAFQRWVIYRYVRHTAPNWVFTVYRSDITIPPLFGYAFCLIPVLNRAFSAKRSTISALGANLPMTITVGGLPFPPDCLGQITTLPTWTFLIAYR